MESNGEQAARFCSGSSRSLRGAAVGGGCGCWLHGDDGKADGEDRDAGRVLAAHGELDGVHLHGGVDH